MSIITRAAKGSALTHAEVDTNFTDLRDGVGTGPRVPKTKGVGIRTDSLGTPTFPWHNLPGSVLLDASGPGSPVYVAYRGNIKQLAFDVGDGLSAQYTLPHDYLPGSDIFVQLNWSHNSALVTGGSVTFGFERIYAKGHGQAAFGAPLLLTFVQNASLIQYQHMTNVMQGSIAGGSATQFDSAILECDGDVIGRLYLITNAITVSGGAQPKPYVHGISLNYQSTGLGTKARVPDFWT